MSTGGAEAARSNQCNPIIYIFSLPISYIEFLFYQVRIC